MPFAIRCDTAWKVVFGQREQNSDRLQLRDYEHGVRVIGVNDVPRIDLPQANPSRDRRRDVAIDEIQLGAVDGRLIVPDGSLELVDRGLLRIHLLLRHGSGTLQQSLEALVVQLGIAQGGLIPEEGGLSLIERNLVGSGIDHGQKFAAFDILAFLEIHLHEFAVDPALHADRVVRSDRSQAGEVVGHVTALGGCHRHRNHLRNVRPGRTRLRIASSTA